MGTFQVAIEITPEMVEACYEWLRLTPPFRAWKLPSGDGVEFRVTGHRDRSAHFRASLHPDVAPEIATSVNGLHDYSQFVQAVAHELVHFYLDRRGMDDNHGPNFLKAARRVCKHFGWEEKDFVDDN